MKKDIFSCIPLFLIILLFSCENSPEGTADTSHRITAVSRDSIMPGEKITITGDGFGDTRITNCKVLFGEMASDSINFWSNDTIIVIVPEIKSDGQLTIEIDGQKCNNLKYYLRQDISIDSIMDSEAWKGEEFQIFGRNFGNGKMNSEILFIIKKETKKIVASSDVLFWSDTCIKLIIPEGLSLSYGIAVRAGEKTSNSRQVFIHDGQPVLESIEPTVFYPNEMIKLTATNVTLFPSKYPGSFTFGGVPAEVIEQSSPDYYSNKSIVMIKAPASIKSGKLKFQFRNAISNEIDYLVSDPPVISGISPQPAKAGSTITITGINFGSNPAGKSIKIGSIDINKFIYWNDTEIQFVIPGNVCDSKIGIFRKGTQLSDFIDFTVIKIEPSYEFLKSMKYLTVESYGLLNVYDASLSEKDGRFYISDYMPVSNNHFIFFDSLNPDISSFSFQRLESVGPPNHCGAGNSTNAFLSGGRLQATYATDNMILYEITYDKQSVLSKHHKIYRYCEFINGQYQYSESKTDYWIAKDKPYRIILYK